MGSQHFKLSLSKVDQDGDMNAMKADSMENSVCLIPLNYIFLICNFFFFFTILGWMLYQS
jgi:hypothetical protein